MVRLLPEGIERIEKRYIFQGIEMIGDHTFVTESRFFGEIFEDFEEFFVRHLFRDHD